MSYRKGLKLKRAEATSAPGPSRSSISARSSPDRADAVAGAEAQPPWPRAGPHLEQHLGLARKVLEQRLQVADQRLVAAARVDLQHDRLDPAVRTARRGRPASCSGGGAPAAAISSGVGSNGSISCTTSFVSPRSLWSTPAAHDHALVDVATFDSLLA